MKALYILFSLLLVTIVVTPSCVVTNITVASSIPQSSGSNSKISNSVTKAILVATNPTKSSHTSRVQAVKASAVSAQTKDSLLPEQYLDPKDVCLTFDLSTQTGTIFYQGRHWHSFPISSGKMGLDTPTGTYMISTKELEHDSREHHCILPYAMDLGIPDKNGDSRGIFVHEGRIPPSGYPSSHRCIRVGPQTAKKLFEATPLGSKVIIKGSANEYYKNHFDGYHLLTFDSSGKPRIKRNVDGSLTTEFVRYVNAGKMEVFKRDRQGRQVTADKGVLCFEFMGEKPWDRWDQGVSVAEFESWRNVVLARQ